MIGSFASPRAWSRPWWTLLGACALLLTTVDALLIGRATDLFSGGFLVAEPLRTPLRFGLFLAASLVFDLTLVLCTWALVLPLLARTRLSQRQALASAALVGARAAVRVPVLPLPARALHRRLDRSDLLLALAGGSPIEWLAQASYHLLPIAVVIGAGIGAALLAVRALRASPARPAPRSARCRPPRASAGLGALALVASAADPAAALSARRSGLPGARAQDLGSRPDRARRAHHRLRLRSLRPGAAAARPGAVRRHAPPVRARPARQRHRRERPGRRSPGRLPRAGRRVQRAARCSRASPHVVLVLLEGMRADSVGGTLDGRELTPFLNRLAREGASSAHAYANSPYTARSRGQLIGGRLAPYPAQSTLVDDFHANGYEVAWFSAQDESFGARESAMLGLERVDVHYDARDDAEFNVSPFPHLGQQRGVVEAPERARGRVPGRAHAGPAAVPVLELRRHALPLRPPRARRRARRRALAARAHLARRSEGRVRDLRERGRERGPRHRGAARARAHAARRRRDRAGRELGPRRGAVRARRARPRARARRRADARAAGGRTAWAASGRSRSGSPTSAPRCSARSRSRPAPSRRARASRRSRADTSCSTWRCRSGRGC